MVKIMEKDLILKVSIEPDEWVTTEKGNEFSVIAFSLVTFHLVIFGKDEEGKTIIINHEGYGDNVGEMFLR